MKKNKKIQKEEDINIKLKPFIGIPPFVYVPILWAVFLIVFLYAILFMPAKLNPGKYIEIKSIPPLASIYIDNSYEGRTPLKIFLEDGDHFIKLAKTGWEEKTIKISVQSRRFATLFFPDKEEIYIKTKLTDIETLTESGLKQYAKWAMTGNANSPDKIPPVLSWIARDIAWSDKANKSALIKNFLNIAEKSAAFAAEKASIKDLLSALIIANGTSPLSAIKTINDFNNYAKNNKNIYNAIEEILSQLSIDKYGKSKFYAAIKSETEKKEAVKKIQAPSDKKSINFMGYNFIHVPGGYLTPLSEQAKPIGISGFFIDDFYILDREVTTGMYRQFVKEAEKWQIKNKDRLLEEKLADKSYRYNDYLTTDAEPVSFVSIYAAIDFCKWLDKKLPAEIRKNYTVTLPTEYQWLWAALQNKQQQAVNKNIAGSPLPANKTRAGKLGIMDMEGNLWEWTISPYTSHLQLGYGLATKTGIYTVKGGSFLDITDKTNPYIRGVQLDLQCSPVIGFRPVLVRRTENE